MARAERSREVAAKRVRQGLMSPNTGANPLAAGWGASPLIVALIAQIVQPGLGSAFAKPQVLEANRVLRHRARLTSAALAVAASFLSL